MSTTTSRQSGPESYGNEGVPHIDWDWRLTTRCILVSYPGHSLVGFYSSAEMQTACSTTQADWTKKSLITS